MADTVSELVEQEGRKVPTTSNGASPDAATIALDRGYRPTGVGKSGVERGLRDAVALHPELTCPAAFDEAINMRRARIGVIGLGYAGLPLAVGFSQRGFAVTGIDLNRERVDAINRHHSYLVDVTDGQLSALKWRFHATDRYDDVAGLAALIVCVQTPMSGACTPDLSAIRAAVGSIASRLRRGQLIVLQSTTMPGTTQEVVVPILERATGGKVGRDFFVGYAPERIDPGNCSGWTLHNTAKVVAGVTEECSRRVKLLFEQVSESVVTVSSTLVAELSKVYENTFRQVNIALANELALMCHRLSVSACEVIEAAASKPFGFLAHYPGPGLGGDCIPVVPRFLSHCMKERGYTPRLIETAHEINSLKLDHVLQRVTDALNDCGRCVQGARVLLLGVAYKPGISDVRGSPALEILRRLRDKGALVSYVDPFIPELELDGRVYRSSDWTREVVREADCVVVLTHHALFSTCSKWDDAKLIVDTRNVVPKNVPAYRI